MIASQENRCGNEKVAARVFHEGSHRDHVDLAKPQHFTRHPEPRVFAKAATILRRKRSGAANLCSVDERLPGIVHGLDVQFDRLTFPVGRHVDEAAIPGEPVLRGKFSAGLAFPGIGNRDKVPIRLIGMCRRND